MWCVAPLLAVVFRECQQEVGVPTYQYACTESACGHRFDAVQGFSDEPLTTCPVCDGRLRKVFSAVGVVFKGSGFYRTDSRAESRKSSSGQDASSGTSGSSTSSDSGSDSDSGSGSSAGSSAGSGKAPAKAGASSDSSAGSSGSSKSA